MQTMEHGKYALTFSTDIYGSIHCVLTDNQAFLTPYIENNTNSFAVIPQMGITFYSGNPLDAIKLQLSFLLQAFNAELASRAITFLEEFLNDPQNLSHQLYIQEVQTQELN